MRKKHNKPRNRYGLQVVTLCISTAMVLILLGIVVFSVLTARNLSAYFKENIVITMLLDEDISQGEARQLCGSLAKKEYVADLEFISKEQALKEKTAEMGSDPTEFIGTNPFIASIELRLKADYANNEELKWITKDLKKYPQVSDITYQKNLMDTVNDNLRKINLILLVVAGLLIFVSFSLINNTVRLEIYSRRFSIHTMKLVGASWGFIRKPFLTRSVAIGFLAAIIADAALAGFVWGLYSYEPGLIEIVTWDVWTVTGASVVLFGIAITALCAAISINKFLRMSAGELYKI